MSEIVNFDILKTNRNRGKICKCSSPKFELDEENRIVRCLSCEAILDPFSTLLMISEKFEKLENGQIDAIENIKKLKEDAEFWKQKRLMNKVFKNMEMNYQREAFPVCPRCDKSFDPTTISKWSHIKEDL